MRCALLLLILCLAGQAGAERFVTWVDDDGKVRHTRVTDPKPADSEPEIVQEVREAEQQRQPSSESLSLPPMPIVSIQSSTSEPDSSNAAEQAPSNATEPGSPGPLAVNPASVNPAAADDKVDFDTSDYIDAAELEKQGFVRDGKQTFYTWIDAEGNLRSAPVGDSAKSVVVMVPEKKNFAVVAREERLNGLALPSGAEPQALAMLGLDRPPVDRDIDKLAAKCCGQFADLEPDTLRGSRDQIVFFEDSEEMMDFGLGYSYYRFFKLPEDLAAETLFQLRSFVRRSMFSPVVLTLDEDFKPVRMMTDILYVYEAGSWSSHAFMEGYFRLPSLDREPYLVIFSRHTDQMSTTVVDGLEDAPLLIPHASKGELYLSVINEDG